MRCFGRAEVTTKWNPFFGSFRLFLRPRLIHIRPGSCPLRVSLDSSIRAFLVSQRGAFEGRSVWKMDCRNVSRGLGVWADQKSPRTRIVEPLLRLVSVRWSALSMLYGCFRQGDPPLDDHCISKCFFIQVYHGLNLLFFPSFMSCRVHLRCVNDIARRAIGYFFSCWNTWDHRNWNRLFFDQL